MFGRLLRNWLWAQARQRFRSGILRNATWMLSGQGLQLVGRFAYFVMVGHALGPTGYGAYVACTALITAMSPFAAFGTGDVMLKNVARDRSVLSIYFGNALLVSLAFGSALALFALMIRPWLLPSSVTAAMLLFVAIAEFFGTQMTLICAQVFLALEEGPRQVKILTWSVALRVVAALLLTASRPTPLRWALLYAGAGVISTLGGVIAVSRCCARPRLQLNLLVPSVREGFHFATSAASQNIYSNIDKTMLARLSTVEAAAVYSVAYRFIEVAMLPVDCVAAATYPEFFRKGLRGVTSTFEFACRILRRSVIYGVGVAAILFLAAGAIPWIMGRDYQESVIALRWLCVLPVIRSVYWFLTDALTGANYQWQRSSAQFAVAAFNILINLWIIRAYAWRGAAWASVTTDLLLMALLYLIIRGHLRRERGVVEIAAPPSVFATGGE